jgi:hypothetical protein
MGTINYYLTNSVYAIRVICSFCLERKKWISCFDSVTAIIFVASLADYNMTLYEDNSTNRLTESLSLFAEICKTKVLSHINLILFLNKKDLFAEKLATHPLAQYFPEYTQDNSVEETTAWIRNEFETRNPAADTRNIYSHITCATDKNNIRTVFEVVKFILLQQNLDEAFGMN